MTRSGMISAISRREAGGVPRVRPTIRSTAELALDHVFVAAESSFRPVPPEAEILGQLPAIEAAAEALADLAPADLYPPVEARELRVVRRGGRQGAWEQLSFSLPFALPTDLMPSVDQVLDGGRLHGQARILRTDDTRPWVIVVHGARQGRESDRRFLRARHLHEQLGFNVAMPVLPLHGPRRTSPEITVPGLDVLTNVAHALVAVAEIRALRNWIATQGSAPVGIFGISLGGYLTALCAGVIDPPFDVVVVAIPVIRPHELMAGHIARLGGRQGRRMARFYRSEAVARVDRFVDPLRFEPGTPVEHRHVLGGLLDGVTTPQQAADLARHWRVGNVRWYGGGHIGHAWSSTMRADVDAALLTLYTCRQERSIES